MNVFAGYRISSPFGIRMHPVSHKYVFHRGIDLVVTPGNGPLYAFIAGVVTHAKMGSPGIGIPADMGIVVAIKDDKGYLHLYAHLSSALVKVGEQVEKGHIIGNQGTTGKDSKGKLTSTGPHLHYEVRKVASPSFGWTATESGAVEPTQYLVDYYTNEQENEQETPKEDEDEMKAIELIDALEQRIAKLETLIEAPVWFVKEFGSADLCGKIHDPHLTAEGWRVLAIGLRINKSEEMKNNG